jgi:hypothetical protein
MNLPDPAEWDFRSITEEELPYAIRYEYLRESSLKDVIVAKIKKHDGMDWTQSGEFAWNFPLFPAPWVKLPVRKKASFKPLSVVSIASRLAEWRENFGDKPFTVASGTEGYFLKIKWGEYNLDEIMAEFRLWLRVEALKNRRVKRGVGSLPPWAELKRLAALRVAQACKSSKPDELKKEILKYELKFPSENSPDVLPDYTCWDKALNQARQKLLEVEAFYRDEPPELIKGGVMRKKT